MPTNANAGEHPSEYAMEVADGSYRWYLIAAKRSRRSYRLAEFAFLSGSALVTVTAVVAPDTPVIPAVIGAVLVVVSGLRSIFHWQENYLRYSQAREAVEAERRRYRVGARPYDDPQTRDAKLIEAVTRIERDEMRDWTAIADTGRGAVQPFAR